MKNELGTVSAAVGASALVLLFAGLALAIFPGWPVIGTWAESAQGPAWVQALGSIGALMATGLAVRHAHQLAAAHQLAVEDRAAKQLLEAVFQLVGGVHQIAAKIQEHIGSLQEPVLQASTVRLMHAEILAVVSALQKIDVTRLDNFHNIQAVLVAIAVVPELIHEMDVALQHVFLSGEVNAERIDAAAAELAATLKPFGEILLKAVNARGGQPRTDTFTDVNAQR